MPEIHLEAFPITANQFDNCIIAAYIHCCIIITQFVVAGDKSGACLPAAATEWVLVV